MGRVFTPEQIIQRAVPEEGAHEKAGRYLLDKLFVNPDGDALTTSVHIPAGMIYGSTAMGSANVRSDLDCLFYYHPKYAVESINLLRRLFQDVTTRYLVPIEAQLLTIGSQLDKSLHAIDPLFAAHLYEVQCMENPRWSQGWPVSGLESFMPEDAYTPNIVRRVQNIATVYCSAKARKFTKALANPDEAVDYHDFQRALELPSAVGRKVLAVTLGLETLRQDVLQNKREVSLHVCNVLRDSATPYTPSRADEFLELCEINDSYNSLLQDIPKNGSIETYLDAYELWITQNYRRSLQLALVTSVALTEIMFNWNVDDLNGDLDLSKPEQDFSTPDDGTFMIY